MGTFIEGIQLPENIKTIKDLVDFIENDEHEYSQFSFPSHVNGKVNTLILLCHEIIEKQNKRIEQLEEIVKNEG